MHLVNNKWMARLGRNAVCTVLLSLGLAVSSQAQIAFIFDYSGSTPGVGFSDPTLGAARRQALTTAGNLFSNLFASHFSNTATITMSVFDEPTGVASAGTDGIAAPGFGNGEVVRNKVISNGLLDLNGAGNDGFLFVNWANDYVIDPNAPINYNGGQIDFFSVIDHEFTHAFGFGSNIDAAGDTPSNYSKWDQFLTSKSGIRVVDPITGLVNHAAYLDAQTNGGLFDGPNATLAYPGGVPLVVSDDISHLNQDAFTQSISGVPNALMRPSGTLPDLFVPRVYNAAEVGILTDIGYTAVAAVPEPGSIALLAGMMTVGVSVLRKRRKQSA